MDKCTVVAKRELFYAWPFGLAAWLAGLIFIDRVRGEKARDTLNQVNSKIKKQKIKLWVFPEGTRRNTGEIHPFKKGAFHMAIDEQIPILPVVFSSYCSFLNDKKKILNAGNIILTALPAIPTKGLTKDDLPKLMEFVHELMQGTFKSTSNEVLQRYATTGITKTRHSSVQQKVFATRSPARSIFCNIEFEPATQPINLITTTATAASSQPQDILNSPASATAMGLTTEASDCVADFKDPLFKKTPAVVH